MDARLLRLFAVSVVVVGVLIACQRGNPMQPSVARLDDASRPVVVPRDACAHVPSACLTGDPNGAGSLEVLAARPLEPSSTWNVMAVFEDSGDRSHAVSAVYNHTAAAPIAAQ
jgi:hypothetical protein